MMDDSIQTEMFSVNFLVILETKYSVKLIVLAFSGSSNINLITTNKSNNLRGSRIVSQCVYVRVCVCGGGGGS